MLVMPAIVKGLDYMNKKLNQANSQRAFPYLKKFCPTKVHEDI